MSVSAADNEALTVEALSRRATGLLERNRFEEALAGFATVLARDTGHAASWSNRGNALIGLRRFEEAIESYDRALAIRANFPAARSNRSYALGMRFFEKQEYASAETALGEALRLNPLLLDGFCMRGIALARLKRHEEALACFARALSMKTDFVEALIQRATVLLELNRLDAALAGFDRALDIAPDHSAGWNNRGNVLTNLKRYEEAVASYDRALAIRPEFPESRDNRANALFLLGRLNRCPPAYMRTLFDDYCSYYDSWMVETLSYRGHLHLRRLAGRVLGGTAPRRILDLGCGTGLVGETFRDIAGDGSIDGIDLSPRMLAAARRRGIYRELIAGDLEAVLAAPGPLYDLVLAADTMVYFGNLARSFGGVANRLEPAGFFIFAVESLEGKGWEQSPMHRFRHSEAYLRAESESAGLEFAAFAECILRREANQPVAGLAVALRKIR